MREARLFGREEPEARAGALEEAAGGTLFINEIEDLPPGLQRLLVGVLESGHFTRLDGTEPMPLPRARALLGAAGHRESRRQREACVAICSRT